MNDLRTRKATADRLAATVQNYGYPWAVTSQFDLEDRTSWLAEVCVMLVLQGPQHIDINLVDDDWFGATSTCNFGRSSTLNALENHPLGFTSLVEIGLGCHAVMHPTLWSDKMCDNVLDETYRQMLRASMAHAPHWHWVETVEEPHNAVSGADACEFKFVDWGPSATDALTPAAEADVAPVWTEIDALSPGALARLFIGSELSPKPSSDESIEAFMDTLIRPETVIEVSDGLNAAGLAALFLGIQIAK